MLFYERSPGEVRIDPSDKIWLVFKYIWWFLVVPAVAAGLLFNAKVRGMVIFASWPILINAVLALACVIRNKIQEPPGIKVVE